MLYVKLNIQRFADGGTLVITTEIDNSGIEKDLKTLENEMKKYEDKLRLGQEWTEEEANQYKELLNQYSELEEIKRHQEEQAQKELETLKEQEAIMQDKIKSAQDLKNAIAGAVEEYKSIVNDSIIDEKDIQYAEDLKKDIISMAREYEKMTGQKINIPGIFGDAQSVQVSTINLQKGFNKLFKGAKKLAMGILGVRAAYGLVRKMASSYLADNEQTAQRIQNIWTGLGVVMENIIEGIVTLAKKAVTAILYFVSLLTKVNYIEKANEAILKKRAKATANLRKEQNKLNASFDEMEILQDNSSLEGLGAGNKGEVELFDVNELGNAKKVIEDLAIKLQPVWDILKGIIDFSIKHPGVVLTILGGVALLKTISSIIGVAGAGTALGAGLAGILGALIAIASIGVIVISIKTVYDEGKKVADYNNEVQDQIKNNDKVSNSIAKSTKGMKKQEKELDNITSGFKSSTKLLSDQIKATEESRKQNGLLQKTINGITGTTKTQDKQMQSNIKNMYSNIIATKNLYDANQLSEEGIRDYVEQLVVFQSTLTNADGSLKNLTGEFGYSEEGAKKVSTQVADVGEQLVKLQQNSDDGGQKIRELANSFKDTGNDANSANTNLEKVDASVDELNRNSDVSIKVNADTKNAQNKINALVSSITGAVDQAWQIALDLVGTVNRTGGKKSAKGSIIYPKLAVGGIINQPGRGVAYNGAIIGERGAEAVLPLTDSQQMALLGEAIGKYITINANIINTMNGRIISKELQKIQNESDFAYNR